MSVRTDPDQGVIGFITDVWPLLALGVIGALLIRACVPLHPAVPPATVSQPTFDPQTAVRVGNWHAMSALTALTSESGTAQVLDALNLLMIDFAADGSTLPDSVEPVLARVAALIKGRPLSERFELTGHADGAVSPLSDLELSRRRAQAVVDFLVNQGVPAQRLQARGAAAEDSAASEPGEDSNSRNQRIQFALLR